MKRHCILPTIITCFALFALVACEKSIVMGDDTDNDIPPTNNDAIHLRLNANNIESTSYNSESNTSRATDASLKDVCNHISLAIFDANNDKIKTQNQSASDKTFGHFDINLPKGIYNIVFIAHNANDNPSIISPSEIKFHNNKVTDTFYYYGTLELEDDTDYNITLKRAVAKLQFIIKDKTPKEVKQMKFYYTGGSSTLDATTGYGCVNSKQTEYRTVVSDAYNGESQYEVYTFPHEDNKPIKFVISALNGTSTSSTAIYSKTIEDVIMKRNTITQYSGYYFGEEPGEGRAIDIRIDDEWLHEYYEY